MSHLPQAVSPLVPMPSLVPGFACAGCRVCVTIPVRNEEQRLAACLEGFASQVDVSGRPLTPACFEILLLLNNCTDRSAEVAARWARAHPDIALHTIERDLPQGQAHAGTARRLLMDTAWQRLGGEQATGVCAILTTDADSVVAPDWIAQNLAALHAGAEAVGGAITIRREDLEALPEHVRRCYEADRCYAACIAELEDLLDPQPGDPCPRHLDHFGSSLACTTRAYGRVGGLPAVPALEDEAFVDSLRQADIPLRHEPAVRIATSARLDGRTGMGFAGQLRFWNDLPADAAHTVPSAAFLIHRFRTMRLLREAFAAKSLKGLPFLDEGQHSFISNALRQEGGLIDFLGVINCDGLIRDTLSGPAEEPIGAATQALRMEIGRLRDHALRSSTEMRYCGRRSSESTSHFPCASQTS